ncbi:hypothetical protein CRE_07664 [Caenorhabditis remanei]|uniref:Uncharacterized protein n=1 Tax=Caenorhabditis remanei TaxID=31234 RepID=E3MP65_CAERE|nr:hypothetical protein CRE_07664 [Caenorhabditis remanei]
MIRNDQSSVIRTDASCNNYSRSLPGLIKQSSGSPHCAHSSRRNKTSKKTGGNRKKSNHSGSSKSSTAKQWKNLAPAKTIFSKRAKKTALMIEGIQLILDNPDEPEITSILQASYTKLSEQLTKLDNSDSEALSLVLKHPALCSNSEAWLSHATTSVHRTSKYVLAFQNSTCSVTISTISIDSHSSILYQS